MSLYRALWKLGFFIVCHVCSANFISESLFRPQNSLGFISKLFCPSHSFRDSLCIMLEVFYLKDLFKYDNAEFQKKKKKRLERKHCSKQSCNLNMCWGMLKFWVEAVNISHEPQTNGAGAVNYLWLQETAVALESGIVRADFQQQGGVACWGFWFCTACQQNTGGFDLDFCGPEQFSLPRHHPKGNSLRSFPTQTVPCWCFLMLSFPSPVSQHNFIEIQVSRWTKWEMA